MNKEIYFCFKIASIIVFVIELSISFVGCSSDSMFFPSFDDEFESLSERRLMRMGEPNLPNIRFFPSADIIKQIDIVQTKMNQAWSEMLADLTSSNRHECGFCIYLDKDGHIYLGEMQYGPDTPNTPGSASGITLTVDKDEDDLCAIFHTHTSFRYMPSNCYRATGPSGTDTISANSFNVPSLVYDYDGDIVWGQRTYSEHHVYTCGPYQRPPSR